MTQSSPAAKSKSVYLSFSDSPRIHCGLRWDPPPGDTIGQVPDLDLVYATFDAYGRLVSAISGKDGIRTDETGSLYHSGDDTDGSDSADDERVTLDLFSMPGHIHYIFLAVSAHGNHTFGEIINPHVRLFRGANKESLYDVSLENGGKDAQAYIFVRLDRTSGGWNLHRVNHYPASGSAPDWGQMLTNFLPALSEEIQKKERPVLPKKGETVPLFYTKQARHRVLCGISWDHHGGHGPNVDLDLTCIMFDESGEFADYVTSVADRTVDTSGAVFHTGDDESGSGGGDDEQVSVQLAMLPEDIHHLFLIAELKSKHRISDIPNPKIRIADGMTNTNQLEVRFTDGGANNAYIFARIAKKDDGWKLHYIGEYIDTTAMEDWGQPLRKYLK